MRDAELGQAPGLQQMTTAEIRPTNTGFAVYAAPDQQVRGLDIHVQNTERVCCRECFRRLRQVVDADLEWHAIHATLSSAPVAQVSMLAVLELQEVRQRLQIEIEQTCNVAPLSEALR